MRRCGTDAFIYVNILHPIPRKEVCNMLKKVIAFQKLLLNSTSMNEVGVQSPQKMVSFIFVIFLVSIINNIIFSGNVIFMPILLPAVSVFMVNMIINGSVRLFETVPVSRKFTVFNIFLLSIIIIFIGYIAMWIISVAFVGVILGLFCLFDPQGINQSPPPTVVHQVIDTTKGNLLMLFVLIIILFVGTAISFIKNRKARLASFVGFSVMGYALLFFLKLCMPVSPNSNKVEFIESFSIMPGANTILLCVAVGAVILSLVSIFAGYKLYIKSQAAPTAAI